MVFRDEHEAALQRAEALERERDRAEERRRDAERALERARCERDALAAELGAARRRLSDAGLDQTRPVSVGQPSRAAPALLGVLALMSFALIAPSLCRTSPPVSPPPSIHIPDFEPVSVPPVPDLRPDRCVIETSPAGARVHAGERSFGRTPLSLSYDEWINAGPLEVELDGHEAVRVDAPVTATGCDRAVVLAPRSR